ncbi:molybdopterin converting factor small subunit [Knoellia remsis]|uniref:Molybdopterin converting factor small subunit n=1 Tax=Knoellia remsis TaxID=407159 RepID=A0A2T0UJB8_9MICO|nr:MoaD/ThiS family protein [Knoellia remsis]PRY58039.1 molybdopterin converting factor small subunit [Knoellia remsis]
MTDPNRRAVRPVTVRYWAGARAAAGVAEETLETGPLVGDVLDAAVAAHPDLTEVVAVCSVIVDGRASSRDLEVAEGAVVELLPPFAGG